ncbi:MAG: LuxR C-terminal-related transcriptional regulator [Dysgonamonadaceae bacterium]|jgi:DNA-binding CsgD family transcriptional regulator|nr:LuxR C-terminal-related transcriptional regulator [Dysgonamonadaceae bacterium]
MSRIIKISLFEPSDIIRTGMLSMLNRINSFRMEAHEIDDAVKLKSSLLLNTPDILIVNPCLLCVLPLTQIRKATGNQAMKCIALQSSFFAPVSLKVFDGVISIYDSIEQITEKLTYLATDADIENLRETLTAREKEVVVHVIQGLTNRQIAERMNLSMHTIISHRRNICSKLQIHSTAGLTIYAMTNKLVDF